MSKKAAKRVYSTITKLSFKLDVLKKKHKKLKRKLKKKRKKK